MMNSKLDWKDEEVKCIEKRLQSLKEKYISIFSPSEETVENFGLFLSVYKDILADLRSLSKNNDVHIWFGKILYHHLLSKSVFIAHFSLEMYHCLEGSEKKTPEKLKKIHVLIWSVIIFSVFTLAFDDVVDKSSTRMGHPCWHTLHNLGLRAMDDIFFMNDAIKMILKKYFFHDPLYTIVLEIFDEFYFMALSGQAMDILGGPNDLSYNEFAEEYYFEMVALKAGALFELAVKNMLTAVEITDPHIQKVFGETVRNIGSLCQVENDVLDIHGDQAIRKAAGTDIALGKRTWPLLMALKKGNEEQKEILRKCYGKMDHDKIQAVIQVYDQLNMTKMYGTYLNKTKRNLMRDFNTLPDFIPKDTFTLLTQSFLEDLKTII